MKKVAFVIVLMFVLGSVFVVWFRQENAEKARLQEEMEGAQATAVSEASLRATAEFQVEQAVNTAESETTLRATAEAELEDVRATAVANETFLSTTQSQFNEIANQETAQAAALEAQRLLDEQPQKIETAALLAVEAVKRYPNAQTVRALKDSINLLPQFDKTIIEGINPSQVAYSPDGRFIAGIVGDSFDEEYVQIFDADTGEQLTKIDHKHFLSHSPFLFSPNGDYFAMAVFPNERVLVFDSKTGEELMQSDSLYNLEFNPNGKYFGVVALNLQDKYDDLYTIQIWSIADQDIVLELPASDGSYSFSNDGESVFTINNDVLLTNIESGQSEVVLSSDDQIPFSAPEFSPKNNLLLQRNYEDGPRLYSLENDEVILLENKWFGRPVFSPDEQYVAARIMEGGTGGFVSGYDRFYLWETKTGALKLELEGIVERIAFSPDSQYMAVSFGKFVHVWELKNLQEVARIGDGNWIRFIEFTTENQLLVTESSDVGKLDLWNLDIDPIEIRITHDEGLRAINTAVYSPDGKTVATGGQDELVYLWDSENGEEVDRLIHSSTLDRGNFVNTIAFHPDGDELFVGSGSSYSLPIIRFWDLETNTETISDTVASDIYNVLYSPNGKYLAYVMSGTDVYIVDTNTKEVVTKIEDVGYLDVVFSPDSQYVAATYFDKSGIWDVETGEKVFDPPDVYEKIIFSSDGRLIAGVGKQPFAKIWEFSTGEEIATIPTLYWYDQDIAFSPDNRFLAIETGDNESHLIIWDAEKNEEANRFIIPYKTFFHDIAFSKDGRYLAISDNQYEKSIYELVIFDLVETRVIERLPHPKPIYEITFRPDGQQIMTLSGESNVFLWRWHPDDLVAEACQRLSRNLTESEWKIYFGEEPYQPTCPNLAGE